MELGIPYYAIVTKVASHLTAFCDIGDSSSHLMVTQMQLMRSGNGIQMAKTHPVKLVTLHKI